jgi:hypothetical protein
VPQASCNIDLNFPSLFLDGSHVANGIQANNLMGRIERPQQAQFLSEPPFPLKGMTVGPGGYFLNFTTRGIEINGGHEIMVDRVRP